MTIRQTKGFNVDAEGTKVQLALETVEGLEVVIELLPEAVLEMVLNLMLAKTHAAIRAEGEIPSQVPETGMFMSEAIPADRLEVTGSPDSRFARVRIMSERGAVFEFRILRENLPLRPANAP